MRANLRPQENYPLLHEEGHRVCRVTARAHEPVNERTRRE